MRLRSIRFPLVAIAATTAAIYFFQTRPSDTVFAIQEAVTTKDYETLEKLVDFSALRSSLKQTLEITLNSRPALHHENMNTDLGTMFGNTAVSTIVERTVSPTGLNLVLRGGDLAEISTPAVDSEALLRRMFSENVYREGKWNSLSEYSITIQYGGQQTSRLLLRRNGAFDWKLVTIELL